MNTIKLEKYLLYILASIALIFVIQKAINTGMTHDESANFIYLNDTNIIGFLFDKNAWPNANNHYLNTLSFQFFTRILGVSEFSIRMLSVLSFAIFSWFFIKLLDELDSLWIKAACLLFVIFNPYFMDFFAMARGYAPSIGFSTMAIYFGLRYLDTKKISNLYIIGGSMLLASLSLFSSVILLPAIFGSILVLSLLSDTDANSNFKNLIRPTIHMTLIGLVSLIPLYTPITALSKNDEFKWGSETLIGCFQSLVNHSFYGQRYMPNDLFMAGFFVCILAYAYFKFTQRMINTPNVSKRRSMYIHLIILAITIVIMIAARYSFNSFYPLERKTIFLIPIIGIIFFSLIDTTSPKIKNVLSFLLIGVFIFHFIKTYSKSSVREWWYDRDTEVIIKAVDQERINRKSEKITLNCHWLFWPTLSFYNKTKYPNVEVGNYDKGININNNPAFYFANEEEANQLKDKYELVHKTGNGFSLLKLK